MLVFVLVLAGGSLSLAILGLHFQDALTLAFTSLTLSGPLAEVIDPTFIGFGSLNTADYGVLTVLMLIGRIESSLFLALFASKLVKSFK